MTHNLIMTLCDAFPNRRALTCPADFEDSGGIGILEKRGNGRGMVPVSINLEPAPIGNYP
jgi:hypothetical protein